MPFKNVLLLKS